MIRPYATFIAVETEPAIVKYVPKAEAAGVANASKMLACMESRLQAVWTSHRHAKDMCNTISAAYMRTVCCAEHSEVSRGQEHVSPWYRLYLVCVKARLLSVVDTSIESSSLSPLAHSRW